MSDPPTENVRSRAKKFLKTIFDPLPPEKVVIEETIWSTMFPDEFSKPSEDTETEQHEEKETVKESVEEKPPRTKEEIKLEKEEAKRLKKEQKEERKRQRQERRKQEEEESVVPLRHNFITNTVTKMQDCLSDFNEDNEHVLQIFKTVLTYLVIFGHFSYATYYFVVNHYPDWNWEKGYGLYLVVICFLVLIMFMKYIYSPFINPLLKPCFSKIEKVLKERVFVKSWMKLIIYVLIIGMVVLYLVMNSIHDKERLISLSGFLVIVLIGMLLSKHPGHFRPKQFVFGVVMQFALALITMKWQIGREAFRIFGDRVSLFLSYGEEGTSYTYGDFLIFMNFTFAFKAIGTVFYLASIVSVLYYYNIIQVVIYNLGLFFMCVLETTIIESCNAAANIFLSMTEAPILLRPYLPDLTISEFHTVLAAGFASVSGTVLGLYINAGARSDHLIIACVISAPSTLFFSKIFWPEVEESKTTPSNIRMPVSKSKNLLDAICTGAVDAIPIVVGIVSNVITFMSLIACIDEAIEWLGNRVGIGNMSLQKILSYVLMPLTYLLGIPWAECYDVATLMASKTVVNELVAYVRLGQMIKKGILSKRSQGIATFALCGFSNPGSVGIVIGALVILAPTQRENLMKSIWRAFIAGVFTCLLTGCLAGMLFNEAEL